MYGSLNFVLFYMPPDYLAFVSNQQYNVIYQPPASQSIKQVKQLPLTRHREEDFAKHEMPYRGIEGFDTRKGQT